MPRSRGIERVDTTPRGEVRYAGWMVVEVFDYAPGSEHVARESLASIRRIEADLAERFPGNEQ